MLVMNRLLHRFLIKLVTFAARKLLKKQFGVSVSLLIYPRSQIRLTEMIKSRKIVETKILYWPDSVWVKAQDSTRGSILRTTGRVVPFYAQPFAQELRRSVNS